MGDWTAAAALLLVGLLVPLSLVVPDAASAVTASAAAAGSDVPSGPDVIGQPGWTRLDAALDGDALGGHVVPLQQALDLPPTIQEGIGPGSALRQGVDGIQYVCSASFLLRDAATARYYLATAGHCLVVDAEDPEPVTGATHPEKTKNRVDVCVAGCLNNGLGLGTYVTLEEGGGYHPVAFAESGGIGQDFGIVELPADVHPLLRPALPQWGGPTGIAGTGGTGELVAHYGHGTLLVPGVAAFVSRTPADQGRLAALVGASDGSFSALGHVTGGDSGSAASLAEPDPTGLAQGTEALGVITHAIVYVGFPLMSGTTLAHGLDMVRDGTGMQLQLVPEGDPLSAPAQGPPPTPAGPTAEVAILSPAAGATVRPSDGVVRVEGTVDLAAAGNGSQLQVAIDDPGYGFDSRLPVSGDAAWTATWHPGPAAAGLHVLRARVVSADGVVLDETNQTLRLERSPPPGSGSASSTANRSSSATAAPAAPADPDTGEGASDPQDAAPADGPAGVRVDVPAPPPLAAAAMVALALAGIIARRRRP